MSDYNESKIAQVLGIETAIIYILLSLITNHLYFLTRKIQFKVMVDTPLDK